MTQLPLFLALHLVGLLAALAFGPRRYPALCCALGFAVGVAIAVFVALPLLVLSAYRWWTLAIALATIAALSIRVLGRRRDELGKSTLRLALLWTLAFAAAAAALSYANLAIMTSDSHFIVMLGGVLGHDGGFDARSLEELQNWGVFVVLAHSLGVFTLQDFLYAFEPILGLSFLPIFALTLWHASDLLPAPRPRPARRIAAIAVISAGLFTCYVFAHHLFFIHQNLGTAVYLFVYIALYWLAEVTGDASGLPIAFLALASLALHRTENPVVAVIALVATVLATDLPRREITPLLAAFTAVVAGWYIYLLPHLPEGGAFLTPTLAVFAMAPVLAFFGWWLDLGTRRRWVLAINRHIHPLVAALSLLVLFAMFATKWDHMTTALINVATNLWSPPLWWGYAWYFIVAAALVALAAPTPPRHRALTVTIWLTLAYIMIVVYARFPYRVALVDSANRMVIHVLPLVFLYFGLKSAPAISARSA